MVAGIIIEVMWRNASIRGSFLSGDKKRKLAGEGGMAGQTKKCEAGRQDKGRKILGQKHRTMARDGRWQEACSRVFWAGTGPR